MRNSYILIFVIFFGCSVVKPDTSHDVNDTVNLTTEKVESVNQEVKSESNETTAEKKSDLDASYYYEAEYGDALEDILEQFKITEAQLIQWNPDLVNEIENSFFNGDEKLIIKDPNQ